MASAFDEVAITWDGREYVVPGDQVMGLIKVIEKHVSLAELSGPNYPLAAIAYAFAAALQYAARQSGQKCVVTEEDVYVAFFAPGALDRTLQVVIGLLTMMVPPEHLRSKAPADPKPQTPPRKTRKK